MEGRGGSAETARIFPFSGQFASSGLQVREGLLCLSESPVGLPPLVWVASGGQEVGAHLGAITQGVVVHS